MKKEIKKEDGAEVVAAESGLRTFWTSKRKRLVLLTVLAVLLAGGLAVKYRPRTQKTVQNNGGQNSLIEKYRSQLEELEEKAAKQQDDPKAQRDYAVALYATGDVEKAKQAYLEEQKNNPNDPVLYNNLGNAYRDSKQYDEAITAYKKAIELAPSQQNSYINLAHLYLYVLNKPEEAIAIYQKALEANPDNQDLRVLLGNAYEHKGDKEQAEEVFQQVLDKNPNNAGAKAGLERLAAKQ